jgi:hypothetical protein
MNKPRTGRTPASAIAFGVYKWLDSRTLQSAMHFENMRVTKLTDVGSFGAIISPDGKYIAYVVDELSGKSMSAKNWLWIELCS